MTHSAAAILSLVILVSGSACSPAVPTKANNTPNNPQTMPTNSADQDPLDKPAEVAVPGPYMKAFLVAYEDFRRDPDIPAEKKDISNYSIEFRQNAESYSIFFFARRPENEKLSPGGESSLGKDVSYTVRKSDYKVTSKLFYK